MLLSFFALFHNYITFLLSLMSSIFYNMQKKKPGKRWIRSLGLPLYSVKSSSAEFGLFN